MIALSRVSGAAFERMERSRTVLALLLAVGAADVSVLNAWVVPKLLTATDVSALSAGAQVAQRVLPPVAPAVVPRAGVVQRAEPAAPSTPSSIQSEVVLFTHGTWWIGKRGRSVLQELAAKLASHVGTIEIEIDGYADPSGTAAINRRISEQRARVVAEQLAQAGIDSARIRTRGRGEQSAPNPAFGRRVEIRIGGVP